MRNYYCQLTNGHMITVLASSDSIALEMARDTAKSFGSDVDVVFIRPN